MVLKKRSRKVVKKSTKKTVKKKVVKKSVKKVVKKKVVKKSVKRIVKKKVVKKPTKKDIEITISNAKIEKELYSTIPTQYRTKLKSFINQVKDQGYVSLDSINETFVECIADTTLLKKMEDIFSHNSIDIIEEGGILDEVSLKVDKRFPEVAASERDVIQAYLSEIGKYKLLTAKEEIELSKKIKKYNSILDEKSKKKITDSERRKIFKERKEARDLLAVSNLRLVVSIAKNYSNRNPSLNLLDLTHEGTKGLYKAVDKFDPKLGFKFSTYATCWIKQGITRGLSNHAKTIRIPVHMSETTQRYEKARVYLERVLGRSATTKELAAELGVNAERIHMIRRISQDVVQLDKTIGSDEDGGTRIVDTIIDEDNDQNSESITSQNILKNQVQTILSELGSREREVVELRHGMQDGIQYTLEQIGEKLGVTRERVRQIEAKALDKLGKNESINKLRSY